MPFVLRSEWVGRRVSVRRAVDQDPEGRIRFGDVVGDLLRLDSRQAVIETRNGPVEVPVSHIALAREAHPSTAEILALEAICSRGWRAGETAEIGGWLLRADRGFTGRANSALPLGRPESLPETIEAARAWYAERDLPLKVQVPIPARRLLDSELGDLGFWGDPEVHVLAVRIDQLDLSAGVDFAASERPDDAWFGAYHYRGRPELPTGARELIMRHPRAVFVSVQHEGRTIAIGRGAVDDGWLGITAVEVAPEHRRRGLARRILAGLVIASRRYEPSRVYLQVESTNEPAIALYLSAGFWFHHEYRYRTETTSPDAPRDA
jgi:ribosomal protein S18 acetylase RimI-like enzyme